MVVSVLSGIFGMVGLETGGLCIGLRRGRAGDVICVRAVWV